MDSKRITKAVIDTPFVHALPPEMRSRFAGTVLEIAHAGETRSGEVLFRIGEKNTDEGVFFLEGAIKVTRKSGESFFLTAPEVLGEVQLFTPGGERTATVETVYGGTVLRFSWKELAAEAKKVFTAEELGALRDAIRDSAAAREKHLLTSLPALKAKNKA